MTISQEHLKSLLHYNPETGIFIRNIKASNSFEGTRAGAIACRFGYRVISIDKVRYREHNLAWLYMTGKFPTGLIDHINGDTLDSRWINLREATKEQNQHNANKRIDNTSGVKGISWNKTNKLWSAQINKNGKIVYRKSFCSLEQAAIEIKQARKLLHGEFANHG